MHMRSTMFEIAAVLKPVNKYVDQKLPTAGTFATLRPGLPDIADVRSSKPGPE